MNQRNCFLRDVMHNFVVDFQVQFSAFSPYHPIYSIKLVFNPQRETLKLSHC